MSGVAGDSVIPVGELRRIYRAGRFPMHHGDGLYLHDPDPRAIFPLDQLRPNTRLSRYIRSNGYGCTMDTAFEAVMRACADRPERWISEGMVQAYVDLHQQGHALSVEVWQQGILVGGLYGVKLGRAFFGESMFSRKPNASKAAFYHLVDHLREHGYDLFDTQYLNAHTRSLGAVEVPRSVFRQRLYAALEDQRACRTTSGIVR